MKYRKLIKNHLVQVDHQAARDQWNLCARAVRGVHFFGNEKRLVELKATAGILSHRQTRGFILHRLKERAIRRINP